MTSAVKVAVPGVPQVPHAAPLSVWPDGAAVPAGGPGLSAYGLDLIALGLVVEACALGCALRGDVVGVGPQVDPPDLPVIGDPAPHLPYGMAGQPPAAEAR